MRIHRFFIEADLFQKGLIEYSEKEFLNQIKNVLRLKPGDKVFLFNNEMDEVEAEITEIKKDLVKLRVLKVQKNVREPKTRIVLYCSILKHNNFEIVVQKATEIGIKEIFPIVSERTVKFRLREKRLNKIIKEAAEQAGRGFLPVLHNSLTFSEAIKNAVQNEINLIFDKDGESFKKFKRGIFNKGGIFIGPEGGWSESELKLAKKNNFKVISLGKLTLRAETAAIIASFLVLN
jgi:16S rRNA (uracil1498-N3)-methyltransferase